MNIRHPQLDRVLLTEINHSGRISYNQLYRKIQQHVRPAKSTFNLHLKKLEKQNFVMPTERTIGRPVYYSLTTKSINKFKFRMFGSSKHGDNYKGKEECEDFSDLYLILFYLSAKSPEYLLKNDREFEAFLKSVGMEIKDLKESARFKPDRPPYCRNNIYYYNLQVTRYEHIQFDSCGSKSQILVRREDHKYYALENKSNNLFTMEQRKEANFIESKGIGSNGHVYYAILPGIANSDLFKANRILFRHLTNNKENVDEAIRILKKDGIIKPISIINKELRYSLSDERLRKLLLEYWSVYNFVTGKMRRIWDNFRGPTNEEKEWFSRFWGDIASADIFRFFYHRRQELGRFPELEKRNILVKNAGTILKYHELITRELAKLELEYSDVYQKYLDFPLKMIRELIYPDFLQNDPLKGIRTNH